MAKYTRSQRISKLGNAIRRYRGEYRPDQQTKGKPIKWLTPPDLSAVIDIFKWCESLQFIQSDITAAMVKIDGFKNHSEMAEFMKGLK